MTNTVQLIHIAAKKAGLDDDTRRAKLTNIVGKASTREMTEAERQRVLQVFINEGFAPTAGNRAGRSKAATLSGHYASAVRAFWLSGYNLGVFRERDDRAILAFANGQTGLEHVRFAITAAHGKAIIEAIKAIVRREADLPGLWRSVKGLPAHDPFQDSRVQVLVGQWTVLQRLQAVPNYQLIDHPGAAEAIAAVARGDAVSAGADVIELQKQLGRMIRNAKARAAKAVL